jgi:16S rRNA (uracil1498-N3)-methyltransferase
LNLLILEPHEVTASGDVTLDDARATHVRRVLNATIGQQVRVGILNGPLGVGTLTSTDSSRVSMRCELQPAPPPRPRVDLLLALPRPKVMNRLWAQLSAMGVGRIVLTNAEKVERPYFDTHVLDEAHYRPLLIEGLQQAKDTHLPTVSIHRQFRKLVEAELDGLCPDAVRLVADAMQASPDASAFSPMQASPDASAFPPMPFSPDARVLLAVGPEGGWNDFELELLQAHRFTTVSMGARTLRSDTACIALLALAHAALRRG